jgi:Helicase associated domain
MAYERSRLALSEVTNASGRSPEAAPSSRAPTLSGAAEQKVEETLCLLAPVPTNPDDSIHLLARTSPGHLLPSRVGSSTDRGLCTHENDLPVAATAAGTTNTLGPSPESADGAPPPPPPQQLQALDAVSPDLWDERLVQRQAYKTVNGHRNIPAQCPVRVKTQCPPQLLFASLSPCIPHTLWLKNPQENRTQGHWVSAQRAMYMQHGQETGMNEETNARLEAVGFRPEYWSREARDRRRWDKHFAELQTFKAANGHCNVPQIYKVSVVTPRRPRCLASSHPDRSVVRKSPGKSNTGTLGGNATIPVQGPQKWPRDGHE